MFIGHYGVALALKRVDPKVSLGLFFVATQLVDILWGPFLLLGLERVEIVPGIMAASPMNFVHYPYTHSLVAFIGWSLLTYFAVKLIPLKSPVDRGRTALVLALAVFSHFVLDWITHRPDLPLLGDDSYKLGLGLWNYVGISYFVEAVIFVAGLFIYLAMTRPRDRIGRYGILILALFLLGTNAVNLWGVPPPDVDTIGWTVLISYPLLALIAYWIDRHRAVVGTSG